MKINELSSPVRMVLVLAVLALAAWPAVREFQAQPTREPIVAGPGVTRVAMLSDWFEGIEGTVVDTQVYILEGREPGPKAVITNSHAAMEGAAYLASVILVEHTVVEKGTLYVIPRTNEASFDSTEEGYAYPGTFEIETDFGTRWFRSGSRLTDPVHQWPTPKVYFHYPTGQGISGAQGRNLNRAYPGRPDGPLTEQLAFAVMELVRNEDVDLFYDGHEAPPSRPLVDAMAAHENAMELATLATMYLEMEGIRQRLEASPKTLHGLTHREVGDHSNALAVLVETMNGIDGPLRGPMTVGYMVDTIDPVKTWAGELGVIPKKYPEGGHPLEDRTGRHLANYTALFQAMADLYPERGELIVAGIPTYAEMLENGVGHYLLPVPVEDQKATFGIAAGRW